MFLLLTALLMPGDSIPLPESPFVPRTMPAWTMSAPVTQTPGLGMPTVLTRPLTPAVQPTLVPSDSPDEPQLIEYSDAYLTRLKIHKYASYATLPLFAAAYVTGNELITKGGQAASWARNTHGTIAGALGVLFAVNTVTGVWNLYEGRHDPEGRTRRIIHSVLLLAADAGFLATAALAGESEGGEGGFYRGDGGDNSAHRAVAITSMGLAFTGYMTMTWPFRRD
jgi:hypothetical protein